jgi:hypothetical protein
MWYEELDTPYHATVLTNLMMAVYGQNVLWEGEGTIIGCTVEGNTILYKINYMLMKHNAYKQENEQFV